MNISNRESHLNASLTDYCGKGLFSKLVNQARPYLEKFVWGADCVAECHVEGKVWEGNVPSPSRSEAWKLNFVNVVKGTN